jgi:hypothetical protein
LSCELVISCKEVSMSLFNESAHRQWKFIIESSLNPLNA